MVHSKMITKLFQEKGVIDVYAVTKEQLELLAQGGDSEWKGRWQSAFSIVITCLINMIALGWDKESASFRLNFAIGIIGAAVGALCLGFFLWDKWKQHSRLRAILAQPVQRAKDSEEMLGGFSASEK